MQVLQALSCHTRMAENCKHFIYPYYPAMQLSQMKGLAGVGARQMHQVKSQIKSVWLKGKKKLGSSPLYTKQVIRSELPFSLMRSLIACHFMSYGMLLMKTLLRLIVFFSPVPEFLSFEQGWNLFLFPRDGIAFGFGTYFSFTGAFSSFVVSSLSLCFQEQINVRFALK